MPSRSFLDNHFLRLPLAMPGNASGYRQRLPITGSAGGRSESEVLNECRQHLLRLAEDRTTLLSSESFARALMERRRTAPDGQSCARRRRTSCRRVTALDSPANSGEHSDPFANTGDGPMDYSHHFPRHAAAGRAALPEKLRLLCVSLDEPSWTMLALGLARHGCDEPQFRWCGDAAHALAALREEAFDCAMFLAGNGSAELCYATGLLSAIAAAGHMDPILVVLRQPSDELLGELGAADCEILVSHDGWQSPVLPLWIARAIERAQRQRENARLASADQRRTLRERSEASSALQQQRRFLEEDSQRSAFENISLETLDGTDQAVRELPPQVAQYYEQLLRSTVMMGAGSLSSEVRQLAQLLVASGFTPRAALRLHIERVERLILGLGARGARHVMSRADLLAMELMIQIGDCYRDKTRLTGLGDYGIDLLHERVVRKQPSAGPPVYR
jgi:hypothetical protein